MYVYMPQKTASYQVYFIAEETLYISSEIIACPLAVCYQMSSVFGKSRTKLYNANGGVIGHEP